MNFCKKLYDKIAEACSENSEADCIRKSKTYLTLLEYDSKDTHEHVTDIVDKATRLMQKGLALMTLVLSWGECTKTTVSLSSCEDGESGLKNYLVITKYQASDKIKMYNSETSSIKYDSGGRYKLLTLIIYDDKGMQVAMGYGGNIRSYRPCTAKDIGQLSKELKELLFSLYSKDSMLYKDMIRDDFYPPIPIERLSEIYSKKDYLEELFKVSLPKSANKHSFKYLYAACCTFKYIKEDQFPLMFNSPFEPNDFTPSIRRRKQIAKDFIQEFMERRIKANINPNVLIDYIDFSCELKENIDVLAGKKKITRLHDEYSQRIIAKTNRGKKLEIPETPLKYLELPSEFHMLKTKKAVLTEGVINHNCVGTYIDYINSGDCIIFSADVNNEHLTIEVCCRKLREKYDMWLNQCYTRCNQSCKPETYEYVEKCINEAIPKANEVFAKHNPTKRKVLRNG